MREIYLPVRMHCELLPYSCTCVCVQLQFAQGENLINKMHSNQVYAALDSAIKDLIATLIRNQQLSMTKEGEFVFVAGKSWDKLAERAATLVARSLVAQAQIEKLKEPTAGLSLRVVSRLRFLHLQYARARVMPLITV